MPEIVIERGEGPTSGYTSVEKANDHHDFGALFYDADDDLLMLIDSGDGRTGRMLIINSWAGGAKLMDDDDIHFPLVPAPVGTQFTVQQHSEDVKGF